MCDSPSDVLGAVEGVVCVTHPQMYLVRLRALCV